MIAQITGRLLGKTANSCVVEAGGVGFRLQMSANSLSRLPAEGDEVSVYTHLHVREDELSLFGFESLAEQDLFERLVTVSGVGPKVALSALSSFSPDDLVAAVLREDDALIATVPGIGKKTAQRLIIELKDKVGGQDVPGRQAARSSASAEASDALASMGFSPAEVAVALKGYQGADDPQSLLRYALKRLGGAS